MSNSGSVDQPSDWIRVSNEKMYALEYGWGCYVEFRSLTRGYSVLVCNPSVRARPTRVAYSTRQLTWRRAAEHLITEDVRCLCAPADDSVEDVEVDGVELWAADCLRMCWSNIIQKDCILQISESDLAAIWNLDESLLTGDAQNVLSEIDEVCEGLGLSGMELRKGLDALNLQERKTHGAMNRSLKEWRDSETDDRRVRLEAFNHKIGAIMESYQRRYPMPRQYAAGMAYTRKIHSMSFWLEAWVLKNGQLPSGKHNITGDFVVDFDELVDEPPTRDCD